MSLKCGICKNEKEESEVIILLCKHTFCWSCIELYLTKNLKNKNKCPDSDCGKILKDNEVRKILSEEDIQRYNNICLRTLRNHYECLLPDCGRVSLIDGVHIQFDCAFCTVFNCVNCKLAHKGMLCGESIARDGQSLQVVCQTEMNRANTILQTKLTKSKREDIIEREKLPLIPNSGVFTCELCTTIIAKQAGIVLRRCFHEICRNCLVEHIKSSSLMPVPCPFSPCKGIVEDPECRELLSDSESLIYEKKSIKFASKYFEKADYCRQFNCTFMYELDKTVKNWECPLCKSVNCVECNAIHADKTCAEYLGVKTLSKDDKKIEELIKKKELMRCLDCRTILKKTSGCNWIPCSNCGMELCWINQTYRWGPKGPGDDSGGCKCGVNGKMCHQDCRGCFAEPSRRHARYRQGSTADYRPFNLLALNPSRWDNHLGEVAHSAWAQIVSFFSDLRRSVLVHRNGIQTH